MRNFSDLLTGMTGYVGVITDENKIKQMDTAYSSGFGSGVVNTIPHGKKLFFRKEGGARYQRIQIRIGTGENALKNVYVCKFITVEDGIETPYAVFMGSLFRTTNPRNLPKKAGDATNHNEPSMPNWPTVPGVESADAMLDYLETSGRAIIFESQAHTWDIERRDGTPVGKGSAYVWNFAQ